MPNKLTAEERSVAIAAAKRWPKFYGDSFFFDKHGRGYSGTWVAAALTVRCEAGAVERG